MNKIYAKIQKLNVENARISSKALNTVKTLYNNYDNTVAKENILSKEQSKETNTLHTPTTKLMEETLHIPGAWADLLLEDTDPSWTTVQRKKRKTK